MSAAIVAMNHGRLEDAPNVLQQQIEGHAVYGKAQAVVTIVEWGNGCHQIQLFGDDTTPMAMAGSASLLSHIAATGYMAQAEDK